MNKEYILYHIPGKKIGVTSDLYERVTEQQGYEVGEYEVLESSNDIWYGFCNDQYCFSSLQALVAHEIGKEIGEYYHFAHNLHLYNDKINE